MDQVVEDLLCCLDDPALALLQWNEAFGVVQVRCTLQQSSVSQVLLRVKFPARSPEETSLDLIMQSASFMLGSCVRGLF